MKKFKGVAMPTLRPDRPALKVSMAAALLLAISSTFSSMGYAQTAPDVATSTLPSANRAQTFTVLDTLAAATPRTTFSVFGSGGNGIFNAQFVGPRFTLTRRAVLVRVGAFVNNCGVITSGVPECPNALPFVVQIRRSVNGVPDPDLLIAAAPLTDDNNPLVVSFESANFDDVPLEAGTYFAIFAPQQATDSGILLSSAQGYLPRLTSTGMITPNGSTLEPSYYAAVQIIARSARRGPHANANASASANE